MNHIVWTKKKAAIALSLCAIIAFSSVFFMQNNQTTQAALINPQISGLVSWLKFDEGSGSTAYDSSGNGNDAKIFGATWVNGKYGGALSFDGVSSYATVSDSASLNSGSFSISFWINLASPHRGAGYYLLQKGNWAGVPSGSGWAIYLYPQDTATIHFLSQSASSHLEVTDNFSLNAWNNFVMTFDGTTNSLKVYKNGNPNPIAAGTLTGAYLTPAGYPINIMQNINGLIDDVRIYNRALSSSEIQANYNNDPGLSTNILAKIPKDATQVITTFSWQGTGSLNVTIISPSQNYTENMLPEYQKTSYSTSNGITSMLNIKRLSVSVPALSSDQNWQIDLALDKVDNYQITVEVQK